MIGSITRRHRWTIGGLLIAGTLVALMFVLTAQGGSPPVVVDLQGVPPDALVRDNIILTKRAPGAAAKVTADQARRAAGFQDAGVREILLTHLLSTQNQPQIDRLVWVVNFDPPGVELPGGPLGAPHSSTPIFMLAFVDAETGEFLFGTADSGPN